MGYIYIYPKKLQFTAYGQFILKTVKLNNIAVCIPKNVVATKLERGGGVRH